jgi:hypothetical protein
MDECGSLVKGSAVRKNGSRFTLKEVFGSCVLFVTRYNVLL